MVRVSPTGDQIGFRHLSSEIIREPPLYCLIIDFQPVVKPISEIGKETTIGQIRKVNYVVLTDEKSSVRSSAASALAQVGAANPEVVPQLAKALVRLLDDEDSDVRSSAAYILGQLMAINPEVTTPHTLFMFLTTPLDSQDRVFACRAIFFIALRDQSRQKPIQDELKSLADRPEPHVRIAANQTLEMLYIADLAHTAASDAKQRDEITSKLQSFVDVTFFGENFSWAAREALNWLYTR